MKIAILLKQVPDTEARIKIKPDGRSIDEAGIKWIINPYDEYAVEEGLRLKDGASGEVVIISAGPVRSVEAIRQALAMGADKGVHINTEGLLLDTHTTSLILSNFLKENPFDIIFAGKQAVDTGEGQVFIHVATVLGWPHISPVEDFSLEGKIVVVKRALPGGRKEMVESKLPCVIGCEKGLNEPRFATLPNIMKAKKKEISSLKGSGLLGKETVCMNILRYELPPERAEGKILKGNTEEVSEQLVKLLREEAKVI